MSCSAENWNSVKMIRDQTPLQILTTIFGFAAFASFLSNVWRFYIRISHIDHNLFQLYCNTQSLQDCKSSATKPVVHWMISWANLSMQFEGFSSKNDVNNELHPMKSMWWKCVTMGFVRPNKFCIVVSDGKRTDLIRKRLRHDTTMPPNKSFAIVFVIFIIYYRV